MPPGQWRWLAAGSGTGGAAATASIFCCHHGTRHQQQKAEQTSLNPKSGLSAAVLPAGGSGPTPLNYFANLFVLFQNFLLPPNRLLASSSPVFVETKELIKKVTRK